MLHTLRIRNLVIIEDMTVEFTRGLNLLTGETGTGKSIVVDAVGLAVGRRADRSLIRDGADKAIVEALFEIEPGSAAERWAMDREMGDVLEDRQFVIRREVSATGGAIRLNGSPCTQAMLGELGALLLELHGQHESRTLLQVDRQLGLLDHFAAHGSTVKRVGELYREVLDKRIEFDRLQRAAEDRLERIGVLEAEIGEIDGVAPRPGEAQELDRQRSVLRNAEEVSRLVEEVVDMTYEREESAAALAAAAARSAGRLGELDSSMTEIAERLASAGLEIQEAGTAARDYRDRGDFHPGRLEEVEARRAALERLSLRYGADEQEILAHRDAARVELQHLRDFDQSMEQAGAAVVQAERRYAEAARKLGEARAAAAARLGPAVERQLGALAFGKARFHVGLGPAPGGTVGESDGGPVILGPRGAESAEFMLAANPGEPPRPLHRVASGGELSRVMLALHAVIEGAGDDRVMVFDEVDAGVGGRVADAVGARLARLARRNQVLCVTHLPQVAAYADRHFTVRKSMGRGRTRTEVAALARGERVEELARMLGGRQATPTSRRHASELLSAAGDRSAAAMRRKT